MALDELDETTALARRDLDVGDFTESLEERTELILSDVAGKTTNEDGGVVGVGELVHGLRGTVEAHGGSAHGRVHASRAGHTHTTTTGHHTGTLVLGGGGGDAHGAVTAVDTLHLAQSTLLVVLVGEANETVSAGHAADGVGHDLGGLARGEAALEERDKDVFVDLRTKVTNEDGVLRTTVVTARTQVNHLRCDNTAGSMCLDLPAVSKATTSSPVELEHTVGVGHGGAVQRQGLGGGSGGSEVDEAVAGVAPTTNIRIAFRRLWCN